ncbi:MAG: hypothetical protein JNJ54_23280 [Myxococcaceae bacterium]|nr:hypothetical protein [Myxococcaceae bacterium]
MRRQSLLLVVLLIVARPALGHDADVIYARLEDAPGGFVQIVTLTNATLSQLAPVDGDGDGLLTQGDLDARGAALVAGVWNDVPLSAGGVPCARSDETARLEDGYVTLTARFRCGEGDLRQDFKVLRVLPTNYRVVLGSQLEGERGRRFAQGVFTALEIPRPRPPSVFDGARLRSGVIRGLADTGVAEGLAALLLSFITAGAFRRGALRLGLLVAGGLVVLGGRGAEALVPWSLGLGALVLGFVRDRPGVRARLLDATCLVLGGALGLRATIPVAAEGLGWVTGLALVAAVTFAAGVPLGRLLARRPPLFFGARLALVALALFSAGLRLT